MAQSIKVIDSHTGGEPTRIIIEGGPDLGDGPLPDRVSKFREHHDAIRRATVLEPRGSDVLVGGLLTNPTDPKFAAGIIFFNNHDYLGMCGHGTIGLMTTLKHLGRITDGRHLIETPVGPIAATISGDTTSVVNVASFRLHKNVQVNVPAYGSFVGDVAWGGNWFFLVKNCEEALELKNVGRLTSLTMAIRQALSDQGITGLAGTWIDHVELFGPAHDPSNDSRNFVLCPGGAYDRSPCGTGTSAKLACLAADDQLPPGKIWRQESIIGSVFKGSYEWDEHTSVKNKSKHDATDASRPILPIVSGSAFVSGEATLILNPNDPFCMGIDA